MAKRSDNLTKARQLHHQDRDDAGQVNEHVKPSQVNGNVGSSNLAAFEPDEDVCYSLQGHAASTRWIDGLSQVCKLAFFGRQAEDRVQFVVGETLKSIYGSDRLRIPTT